MKSLFNLLLTLAAILGLSACTGQENLPEEAGRIVAEELPGSYEERVDAATDDPDLGDRARREMEETNQWIREKTDEAKRDMNRADRAMEDYSGQRRM